jgi:hypothetical protein
MRPRPEHVKDIDYRSDLNYSGDMNKLIEFLSKKWDGLNHLKPKGYKKFLEDYKDYKGMEDPQLNKDEEEFDSFDDSGVSCYAFPTRVSLPHVAYEDKGQGRKPHRVLFGSLVAHGHARGEVYGKYEAYNHAASILSYVMNCKLMDKFKGKVPNKAMESLYEFANMVNEFMGSMKNGNHQPLCSCELCRIEPMTTKNKKVVKKKVRKIMAKKPTKSCED